MLTLAAAKTYSACMKWHAVIVLITIMLGIIAPASLQQLAARDGKSTIGILNVCHATTPAIFASGGEMPCMSASPRSQIPAPIIVYANPTELTAPELLVPQQNDKPPKV
jgi:hypothetical protein